MIYLYSCLLAVLDDLSLPFDEGILLEAHFVLVVDEYVLFLSAASALQRVELGHVLKMKRR